MNDRDPRATDREEPLTSLPVRHDGAVPRVELANWRLKIWGQVVEEREWTWPEFERLARTERVADLNCSDGWSLIGRRWSGVPTRELLSRIQLKSEAAFVMVHGLGGYCANMSLYGFAAPDAMLAHACDGRQLTPEHGWPLRLVLPGQSASKAVKWVCGLEFLNKDWPGTREMSGEPCRPPDAPR